MPQLTKTERAMETALQAHAGDAERAGTLELARKFKRSWIELGESLAKVRDRESWKRWGFASLDEYVIKELHLKRATVDKLCASYGFLRTHAPRLAKGEANVETIPTLQAVDFVARAHQRGAANEDTLSEIKRAAFEDGVPLATLQRRYREVAFPMDDQGLDVRRDQLRSQLVSVARKLADLVATGDAEVPRQLAERVEEVLGELCDSLSV
jgi:hypothetical protein